MPSSVCNRCATACRSADREGEVKHDNAGRADVNADEDADDEDEDEDDDDDDEADDDDVSVAFGSGSWIRQLCARRTHGPGELHACGESGSLYVLADKG